MELIEPKVIAAISGAIKAYIEEKELQKVPEEKIVTPIEPLNIWGITGRQDIMLQRRLWQLRTYKGTV